MRTSHPGAGLSRSEAHCNPWQLKTLQHRLITCCGICVDSQADTLLSIHYPVLNYIPTEMEVEPVARPGKSEVDSQSLRVWRRRLRLRQPAPEHSR